ncbi:hypothetical protein KY362_02875 [Candidatus Woesearchaeota archaeon]|nr:hypothetical protein [Candidatus Woesearchaeota archaeon]
MKEYPECPNCGNPKHHEILEIDADSAGSSRMFRCKACGYKEKFFLDDEKRKKAALERMGDAFREFLNR